MKVYCNGIAYGELSGTELTLYATDAIAQLDQVADAVWEAYDE